MQSSGLRRSTGVVGRRSGLRLRPIDQFDERHWRVVTDAETHLQDPGVATVARLVARPDLAEELDHDFLWRTTRCLPQRGRIGIFNRSYYEEVLIVRVHPEILRAETLPPELLDKKTIWDERYRSINDLESHLYRNGTRILKFFLHVSKEEQRQRFLARLDEPDKNWKFGVGDLGERAHWNDYMVAYEACLRATSTKEAPWHVVPADDKKNARLIIAGAIVETLKEMKMSYPRPDRARRKELESIRSTLVNEKS